MSKLKEIIHQYVVEALQEILDEEIEQIDELSVDTLKSYRDKVAAKYTPRGYGKPTAERPNPKWERDRGYSRAETKIKDNTPLEYEPKVHDLTHLTDDGDVYNHTQTSDEIRDGDVMKLHGGRVATMLQAWPVMHKGTSNALHRTHEGKTIGDIGKRYEKTQKLADQVASSMKESVEESANLDEGVEREDRLRNSVLNDPTNQDKRDALSRAVTKNVRRRVRAMRKRLFVPRSKEDVEEGYKHEIRVARALQKDPSNEKLKADSDKAFNIGIERVRRRMRDNLAKRAPQTDKYDD